MPSKTSTKSTCASNCCDACLIAENNCCDACLIAANKQLRLAGPPAPRVIGVDEISIRKGHSYRIAVSDPRLRGDKALANRFSNGSTQRSPPARGQAWKR